jgi:NADPH:quinone reductase
LRHRLYPFAAGVLDTVGASGPVHAAHEDGAFVTVVAGSEPPPARGTRAGTHLVEPSGGRLRTVVGLVDAEVLILRIAGALPLPDAAEAHRRREAGALHGRLLLVP